MSSIGYNTPEVFYMKRWSSNWYGMTPLTAHIPLWCMKCKTTLAIINAIFPIEGATQGITIS